MPSSNIRYFPGQKKRPSLQGQDWINRLLLVVLYGSMGWMSKIPSVGVLNLVFIMFFAHMIMVQREQHPVLKILLAVWIFFGITNYVPLIHLELLSNGPVLLDMGIFLAWLGIVFWILKQSTMNRGTAYFLNYHYLHAAGIFLVLNLAAILLTAISGVLAAFPGVGQLQQFLEKSFSGFGGLGLFLMLGVMFLVGILVLYLSIQCILGKTPNIPQVTPYLRRWL